MPIPGYWPYDELSCQSLLCHFSSNQRGIEIDNVPPTRAPHGRSVVHLARIHHYDVTSFGLYLANRAPRPLSAERNNSDSELVVRVARKDMLRQHRHGLDARKSRTMLHYMMRPFGHNCLPYPVWWQRSTEFRTMSTKTALVLNGIAAGSPHTGF
jgi:hypothetical protein